MADHPVCLEGSSPKVLAIGPFPPFVGGAAKNTAIICDDLEARGAKVLKLSTNKTRSRAEHSRSFAFLADRASGFLANLRVILSGRSVDGSTNVYLVPDGGVGVAFSVVYARLAAMRFRKLIIHHRSYNHVRRHSRLMALLMRTSPEKTLHVFLDPIMEERFKGDYFPEADTTYVPNAATCDVPPVDEDGRRNPELISVGFLSNLVEDKGFDIVADAFLRLAEKLGSDFRFLLAGRPVGERNVERLNVLKRCLGDRLDYWGEINGQTKADFFRTCDVFVFPTRFSQEAQPNVLYEAMAAGAAIVSTRWAGVPWVLEGTESRLIEAGVDRCEELVDAVMDVAHSANSPRGRQRQIEAFVAKKSDADIRYSSFLEVLLDTGERYTI